ncbi:hypothetical protein CJ030_MR8G004404 [Morella rubra]|uniref:non-specific serine/threonine protein kinase n=1 Tax=Morella rubra TaxID=262757 RepID=A0A6A1UQ63_9ROSI|nr:hypothetical protein CJ030_MR8G004404 [Morella rubra]
MDFKAFVLEYMPNGNLDMWLHFDNRFLTLLQRLNIMIDMAAALEYLHFGNATPIVHCDLKPNNVLLDEDMVAHVADFGIAKLLGDADSVTQTMTLATIGYMAPEYGLEGIVSTRGDVYSYGILLMETFTRKRPTDRMFSRGMSLKHWIEESLPISITEVSDVDLLRNENAYVATKDCLSSVLGLALVCCADLPEQRINMTDILVRLHKVKLKFLRDVEGGDGILSQTMTLATIVIWHQRINMADVLVRLHKVKLKFLQDVEEDMVAHVADFGIAKLLGDGNSLSQTMTLTTIGYMAPDCLSSILELTLDISAHLLEERINMADVLVRLHKVKLKFLQDVEEGNVSVNKLMMV